MQYPKKLKQSTFLTFIDFQKAFDYINHEFLYYKLLNLNINGKVYNSINSLESGVYMGSEQLSLLMYADDVVSLAPT